MPKPPSVPETAVRAVEAYCAGRVPSHARADVRVEHEIRGTSITLIEARPPWRQDLGPEWTKMKVAQLRFDRSSGVWSLFARDRNERWMDYDFVDPSPDVVDLLMEIERDPTGIFWG